MSCWCVQIQTFTAFCPVHMRWYKHVINFDTQGSGCEAILPVCLFFSGCSEEDQCVSWCGNKGELQCHQCYSWCESFIGLHLLLLVVGVVLWEHDIMKRHRQKGIYRHRQLGRQRGRCMHTLSHTHMHILSLSLSLLTRADGLVQ